MNLLKKHKRLTVKFQQKFDISDYGMMWLAFAKGFLIGAILL